MLPQTTPIIIPAIMSVGKCTKRYILENEIIAAKTNAAIPYFRLFFNIAVAEANEEKVCPEGNE